PAHPPLSTLSLLNAPATTETYTLSLHDALPILPPARRMQACRNDVESLGSGGCGGLETQPLQLVLDLVRRSTDACADLDCRFLRSEEHTSELQSRENLVCRLLLEKKKK